MSVPTGNNFDLGWWQNYLLKRQREVRLSQGVQTSERVQDTSVTIWFENLLTDFWLELNWDTCTRKSLYTLNPSAMRQILSLVIASLNILTNKYLCFKFRNFQIKFMAYNHFSILLCWDSSCRWGGSYLTCWECLVSANTIFMNVNVTFITRDTIDIWGSQCIGRKPFPAVTWFHLVPPGPWRRQDKAGFCPVLSFYVLPPNTRVSLRDISCSSVSACKIGLPRPRKNSCDEEGNHIDSGLALWWPLSCAKGKVTWCGEAGLWTQKCAVVRVVYGEALDFLMSTNRLLLWNFLTLCHARLLLLHW